MDGIVTGHEPQFDFPERLSPPALNWLLASVPRSGSSYVSHLLWQTGCLGAPLEFANFEPAGPQGDANAQPARQAEFWQRALTRRTSPNGVFGLKAFPLQLQVLQDENPRLLAQIMRQMLGEGPRSRVVWLRRRDRDAHAISYARALLSGIWRSEQERAGQAEPAFSPAALAQALTLIDEQEAAWTAMVRETGVTPLVLYYEDFLADPQGQIAAVAAYLGVMLDPAAVVDVPQIRRQRAAGSEWQAGAGAG